jgi:hypothetical protein
MLQSGGHLPEEIKYEADAPIVYHFWALALLPSVGIALMTLPLSAFWLMTAAWGLLIIGVLFRVARDVQASRRT